MNATGHMVVARIAWDVMTPAARNKVMELVKIPDNPTSNKPITDRHNDQFTASTYLDEIRPTYSNLHYINQPMDEKNALANRPMESPNSVTFIHQNLDVLRDPKSTQAEKAEALRYTMHLVGDLHQPLHCVNRFTPAHPNGDQGGGQFDIQWNGHMKKANLHSYWDSAAGEFATIQRPLTAQGQETLDAMAARIEKAYPMQRYDVQAKDLDPQHWASEGFAMAASDCYVGIKENGAPSAEYQKKTQADMEKEAALAGYRLGTVLNGIFT